MAFFDLGAGDEDAALKDIIAALIRRDGPMCFRDFMSLALYHPTHGYYLTCDPARDYQSSPNVHPIFGACVARQLAEMWRLMNRPSHFDVLEAGAGSGQLAADVTRWLRSHEPDLYDALSYRLQDATYGGGRGEGAFEALGLPAERVSLSRVFPGDGEVQGCVLSNELIDAFPVHRVRVEGGRLLELRVGLDGERFVDVASEPRPEVACYFDGLGLLPGEACEAEVNLDAPAWIRKAATTLKRGFVLTFDYGYEAPHLYAPWRKTGTFLTSYRHTAGDNPYVRLGRQDMTASVDFTTVVRAGAEAGLRNIGLTTQAEFLAAIGIGEALAQRPEPTQLEAYYALRRSVITLTDTTGLGRIKVLAQGKDVSDIALTGLRGAKTSA